MGGDFRYLGQVIGEEYTIAGNPSSALSPGVAFNTNMPHALMIDPGRVLEVIQPVSDIWTVRAGARLDYVRTEANPDDVQNLTLTGGAAPTASLLENDILYAFYITNQIKLDSHWTLDAGFGQSQRPPTLMERYSDGLFVSTLQSGFTHMVGDIDLQPEHDWQFDVGLTSKYDNLRTRARFFQASDPGLRHLARPEREQSRQFSRRPLALFHQHQPGHADRLRMDGRLRLERVPDPVRQDVVRLRLGPGNQCAAYEHSAAGRDARHADPQCKPRHRLGLRCAAANRGHPSPPGAIREPDPNNPGNTTYSTPAEEATTGFAVCNLRGYYNFSKNISMVAGIDNLFNTTYQEHLDLPWPHRKPRRRQLRRCCGSTSRGSVPTWGSTARSDQSPALSLGQPGSNRNIVACCPALTMLPVVKNWAISHSVGVKLNPEPEGRTALAPLVLTICEAPCTAPNTCVVGQP